MRGLNDRRRRRRNTAGRRFKRSSKKSKEDKGHVIFEGVKSKNPATSYARFQNHETGDVVVANFKLGGKIDERLTYEFGFNKKNYPTKAEAEKAMKEVRKKYVELYGEGHQIGLGLFFIFFKSY